MTPQGGFIPYGRQSVDEDDEQAVLAALRSDFLTQGPMTAQFEADISSYVGAAFTVAVSSATAGLHLAMAALDLEGGEGITTPITFVATANAMVYVGLKPVFADIDPASLNLSPQGVRAALTERTRVIAPVHFAGRPADMAAFGQIAGEAGVRVIEDAAHAIGSAYAGGKIGDCRHSDAAIFSFHPVKTMTTGEGGAITTNDPELYERLLMLRSHGITRDPARLSEQPGRWWYEQQMLGFNHRMTEMQAALGSSQLKKLDRFVDRRRTIVERYQAAFADLDWLQRPQDAGAERISFHLYVVQIDFDRIGQTRDAAMAALAGAGVGSQVHYIPVPRQPWYRETYGEPATLAAADRYYERGLSLPLFPAMTGDEIERVIAAVRGLA